MPIHIVGNGGLSDDGAVRSRLRELAVARGRRFGYRSLHLLLGREGLHLNHKKLRRLYREERLQIRRRGGRAAASVVLYTAAEWDVVAHGAAAEHAVPDTTVCAARIKFIDKALSLPDHDAAQLIRWEWGTPIAWKFASNNRPN